MARRVPVAWLCSRGPRIQPVLRQMTAESERRLRKLLMTSCDSSPGDHAPQFIRKCR